MTADPRHARTLHDLGMAWLVRAAQLGLHRPEGPGFPFWLASMLTLVRSEHFPHAIRRLALAPNALGDTRLEAEVEALAREAGRSPEAVIPMLASLFPALHRLVDPALPQTPLRPGERFVDHFEGWLEPWFQNLTALDLLVQLEAHGTEPDGLPGELVSRRPHPGPGLRVIELLDLHHPGCVRARSAAHERFEVEVAWEVVWAPSADPISRRLAHLGEAVLRLRPDRFDEALAALDAGRAADDPARLDQALAPVDLPDEEILTLADDPVLHQAVDQDARAVCALGIDRLQPAWVVDGRLAGGPTAPARMPGLIGAALERANP